MADNRKQLDDYLARLAERLPEARGVYATGSVALGDYRAGESDVDVLAVVDDDLAEPELRSIAARCSHASLPCPARKLELVVIGAGAAAAGRPDWQLNLNTGEGFEDHVGLDPAAEPRHWFVLDLALAREHGVPLAGPPPAELIGAPPPGVVAEAQADAVAWYAHHEPGAAALLAACRAWHWEATGRFASKRAALDWALARLTSSA